MSSGSYVGNGLSNGPVHVQLDNPAGSVANRQSGRNDPVLFFFQAMNTWNSRPMKRASDPPAKLSTIERN